MIEFLLDIPLNRKLTEVTDLFVKKPVVELHFQDPAYEFIAWGDPISNEGFKEELQKNPEPEFIVSNLYGHYYYILLNKANGETYIGNSMFSILPLYYYQNRDRIIFSENALSLGEHLHLKDISRQFILETILFNYPLFNSSIYKDVKLLPSNSYLKISGTEVKIIKHTKIEEYFSSSPKPWKKSVNHVRDFFLETVKKYLPEKPYVHALTGGFDGRTLVSAGLYHKKEFSCYSFGSTASKDTQIASQLTKQAGIPFINIELNDQYARESSLNCGQEFIRNSSGTATFARAHYLFAAKQLSAKNGYIITGNFGSEIFRAAHVAGAVISGNLYTLFNSRNAEESIKAIENSKEFDCLNRDTYKNCWGALKEDILQLPYYNQTYSGLTKNQRFYVFVFEEIFRKYFGAEMVNQFKYLRNRTPFLDIDFLKAIFKTGLVGIHSDFFEHNPLKRYKGQVLYAHIIKKAYPPFGKMITDKGYKPDDLINFFGKVNIVKGYLKKITSNVPRDLDPYGVVKAWDTNRDYWQSIPVSSDYFNTDDINNINKEVLFKIISLSYLIEKI
ncbi:MAG: hypothetical protein MUO72_12975 [Bacteroidales bacterium]|nr:hypothetical protein [Bacteroidales bacterium]